MAWDAADWEITRSTGDIRYIGADHDGAASYITTIELHRELQKLADDASSSGDDELDITDPNPTSRATDNLITLLGDYNIDAGAAEHIYDGSIVQAGGAEIWDGIVNYGNANVIIDVHQDGAVIADDWWNNSGGAGLGGLNQDAAQGISHRFMLKVRDNGMDIDGRRLVGQARTLDDTNQNTYQEFPINGTARGNNVFAINDSDDLNNNNTATTIATWDQFANDNAGYIGIDVDNDGANEFYFSSLDIGGGATPASPGINDLFEWAKYTTRRGSATTMYGINGELFRGITHEIAYDGEAGTGPVEGKLLVWGQTFAFDGELATDGTPGEYYDFSISGAKGKLLAVDATGNTAVFFMNGTAAVDNDVVTRSDGTAADGFTVAGAPTGSATVGGVGVCLADDTVDQLWIQLIQGVAPVDGTELFTAEVNSATVPIGSGTTYDAANHVDVNVTVTSRSLSYPWIGTSTGSAIIGAYGVGIDTSDLTQNDQLFDLTDTSNSPPNQPIFTVGGLVSTEDRVLVAPYDGSTLDAAGNPEPMYDQFLLATALSGPTETAVVIKASAGGENSGTIPDDTPATGTLRVQLTSGFLRRIPYTSWTGSTFTIGSSDWQTANAAAVDNNVMITYIDDDAAGTSINYQAEYVAQRDLVVIVRDGKTTPIKEFIQATTFDSSNKTVTALRISDE